MSVHRARRRTSQAGLLAVVLARLELSLDVFVLVGSRVIPLGAAQNSLLYLLAANADRHVKRADIRELVWGIERSADDKGVDQAVGQLRRSLGVLPGGLPS